MSIVRHNLLTIKNYSPYCIECRAMDRMKFINNQFQCKCGYRTSFENEFIEELKKFRGEKWKRQTSKRSKFLTWKKSGIVFHFEVKFSSILAPMNWKRKPRKPFKIWTVFSFSSKHNEGSIHSYFPYIFPVLPLDKTRRKVYTMPEQGVYYWNKDVTLAPLKLGDHVLSFVYRKGGKAKRKGDRKKTLDGIETFTIFW
jgi:hypothetical protein